MPARREARAAKAPVTRDGQGRLCLPARAIPVPTTISAEARRFLAAPSLTESLKHPPASDKAAWRAYVAAVDAMFAGRMAAFAARYPGRTQEHHLSAATLYEIAAETAAADRRDCALLYIHGGAFTSGGGRNAAIRALEPAHVHRCSVFSVDYRMPPEHPFPAGLGDCVEAYRWLLARYQPANIAVAGPSAGGGLAASTILMARDQGLPLPAAAILVTPEADLTESGDTFETNQFVDVVLPQRISESIKLYAGGHNLRDPYLSPVFADFSKGFPPTLLISGTRDLFLSNTVILHRALRRAGCEADLVVFEAMPHAGFFGAPEDAESLGEQARFLDAHWPKR